MNKISEKKKVIHSLLFPLFFVFILWMIKISEYVLSVHFYTFGIYPRELYGLLGILTAPLIHEDFNHLINNTIPLFVLTFATFYFYRKIAYKVFFLNYIISGIWVWIMARSAYHIGASGLVYSFAAFIITSGIIRNNIRLLAISLIVVFLYGSLAWGLFPTLPQISWESHLMGAISGIAMAVYYKKEIVFEDGLPSFRFDEYYEEKFWETDLTTNEKEINYEYKEKK